MPPVRIGDIFEHGLAAIAEARSLDGSDLQAATQLVDDERCKSFALDVFSDDEERLARLNDGFENRQHRLQTRKLLLMNENVRALEFGDHLVGVGNEVRREIAAIELHAFDDFEFEVEGLALFDGDDAFRADLFHRFGDLLADDFVAVRRDRADLADLVFGDFLRVGLEILDDGRNREIDAALQIHRVGAGGNRLCAFAHDRLSQNGRRRRAVAGEVGRLGGDLFEHLRAHVLELVFELDLLGDRHAVLRDARRTERLLDDDVAALGAERHLHRVGENIDAAQHALAGILRKLDVFSCHVRATPEFG